MVLTKSRRVAKRGKRTQWSLLGAAATIYRDGRTREMGSRRRAKATAASGDQASASAIERRNGRGRSEGRGAERMKTTRVFTETWCDAVVMACSGAAVKLWLRMRCWCVRHKTDGKI